MSISLARAAVLLGAWVLALSAAGAATPNVVIILADDLGYGDVGCYNAKSKIPTPNLDRLAGEGMRFTDAHAPSSVCTPTRYALLTGRYCWRTRLQRNVLGPFARPLIAADRLTLPQMMREHGYATACIGKWHLGWDWATKDGKPASSGADHLSNVDFTRPVASGPITRGFDSYFGVDVPNYPPFCWIDNDRTVGIPSAPSRPEFNVPGPMLPGWQWVDIMPELTRRAVGYIDESAKASPRKPFFLYFSLTAPHFPVVPAAEFEGKSAAGKYGDFVVQVDWTVGQVLDALKRAGVADETIVLFTSDNGPEVVEINPGAYDRAKQYGHYSMGELRGAKRDTWEGGHRVPFIVRWPGHAPAGAASAELVSHVDFMATLAGVVGAKLPDNAAEDSFDVMPAWLGKGASGRPYLVHNAASGKFGIRRGDWVLVDSPTGDDNGKRGEPEWFKKERGYVDDGQPGQLFDVREDLPEAKNHFAEKPEVVKELKALLEKCKRDGRSTPGPVQKNDVVVPGEGSRKPDA